MKQLEMQELINARKEEIENNLGLVGNAANEALVNWFLQDYFFDEITKEELDDFMALIGCEVTIE